MTQYRTEVLFSRGGVVEVVDSRGCGRNRRADRRGGEGERLRLPPTLPVLRLRSLVGLGLGETNVDRERREWSV